MFCTVKSTIFERIYEIEIFNNRHIRIKRRNLGKVTDTFFSFCSKFEYIESFYRNISGGRRQISGNNIHYSRFSGSVRSEKADNFPVTDCKADVVYSIFIIILFNEIFNLYHDIFFPFKLKAREKTEKNISVFPLLFNQYFFLILSYIYK